MVRHAFTLRHPPGNKVKALECVHYTLNHRRTGRFLCNRHGTAARPRVPVDPPRAGGRAVGNVAFWNGTEWSSMRGGADYITTGLVLDGTNLYLIGRFEELGAGIARWDGSR